ncbi:MAG: hypothetical protein ACLS6G_03325 [Christensenellales bacterium]
MANKHAKAKNPRIRAVISLVAIVVVVAVCAIWVCAASARAR